VQAVAQFRHADRPLEQREHEHGLLRGEVVGPADVLVHVLDGERQPDQRSGEVFVVVHPTRVNPPPPGAGWS
jgi:hypothetical protein